MSNEHETFTMRPPEVSASITGRVPKYTYTCRITALKTMLETHKEKGYKRTVVTCEILGPDPVVDAKDPSRPMYSVAGRKFSLYLPLTPESKQYTDSYAALANWGYKKDDGEIDIQKFWADAQVPGTIVFQCVLDSEEELIRDGAGQPINGPDGKPITRGWQITFVQPRDLLGRVDEQAPNSGPY